MKNSRHVGTNLSLLVSSFALVTVFQNCAPFEASQIASAQPIANSVPDTHDAPLAPPAAATPAPTHASPTPVTTATTPTPASSPTPLVTATPLPGPMASLCATQSGFFCDGFESAMLSPDWDQSVSPNEIHRTTALSYRGQASLQFLTTYRAQLNLQKNLPYAGNVVYGRVFVNVSKLLSADSGPNTVFIEGSREGYSGSLLRIAFGGLDKSGKTFSLGVGSDGGPSGDWGYDDTVAADGSSPNFAINTWHCLEWMMDSNQSQLKVWMNGAERTGLSFDSTSPAKRTSGFHSPIIFNPIGNIAVGYRDYHVTNFQVEFYIDEVAIGPTRIGCGN